jgi:putative FmdB family regulatory protein
VRDHNNVAARTGQMRPGRLVPSGAAVPIYEYRCPNGHTFERFQSMSAPPPETCDVCGAAPVELVLYPIAIHYKGSGFYSTDYGKGKPAKKDEGGGAGAEPAKKESSTPSTGSTEKKAAASGD